MHFTIFILQYLAFEDICMPSCVVSLSSGTNNLLDKQEEVSPGNHLTAFVVTSINFKFMKTEFSEYMNMNIICLPPSPHTHTSAHTNTHMQVYVYMYMYINSVLIFPDNHKKGNVTLCRGYPSKVTVC